MHPPFRADFHADPPIETFKHFEGARSTEMTGGVSVACVHDPRSGSGAVGCNGAESGGGTD